MTLSAARLIFLWMAPALSLTITCYPNNIINRLMKRPVMGNCCPESPGDVIIADTVTSIPAYSFQGCTTLASVIIPNSVNEIGVKAFERCTSLTSIAIPDSVTIIPASAFLGCSSLTSVYIPSGVFQIHE